MFDWITAHPMRVAFCIGAVIGVTLSLIFYAAFSDDTYRRY